VGQGQHRFLLAVRFVKRNTKFGGGESEGGAGIFTPLEAEGFPAGHFPHIPFLPAPPERSVWRAKRAVSSIQKGSDFVKQTHQTKTEKIIFSPFCFCVVELYNSARTYFQNR
jgi:hypothetical protein